MRIIPVDSFEDRAVDRFAFSSSESVLALNSGLQSRSSFFSETAFLGDTSAFAFSLVVLVACYSGNSHGVYLLAPRIFLLDPISVDSGRGLVVGSSAVFVRRVNLKSSVDGLELRSSSSRTLSFRLAPARGRSIASDSCAASSDCSASALKTGIRLISSREVSRLLRRVSRLTDKDAGISSAASVAFLASDSSCNCSGSSFLFGSNFMGSSSWKWAIGGGPRSGDSPSLRLTISLALYDVSQHAQR